MCGLEGRVPALLFVLDAGWMHRATQSRGRGGRVHEILGEPVWDSMGPGYPGDSMRESGRIWPVSEKIDGFEALSSLKARFRSIYVSLGRDLKSD